MNIENIMLLVDDTLQTRNVMEASLKEIDRRALNALILVKRHGKILSGYGVIAQAFREQSASLKISASRMQAAIAPLIYVQMKIMQYQRFLDQILVLTNALHLKEKDFEVHRNLNHTISQYQDLIKKQEKEIESALAIVIRQIEHLQNAIEEQEYIVVNGRIEAALVEETGVPLMRVSKDMGSAVQAIRKAVLNYRLKLEELLNENSTYL